MTGSLVLKIRHPQKVSGRAVHNAKNRSYRAKFIEPGVVSYDDQGEGVVFVSKEALDRMSPTFKGCPVIFVPEHHNDSDPETAFNFEDGADPPAGVVASDPEWGDDGWQYVNLLVWNPDAQKAIENGYSVSCAYRPTEEGPGGDWHNIPYDAEMKNGEYMHMAIVPRPRYEGSTIFANSKGAHTVKINMFRKNAEPPAPPEKDKKDEEGMEMVNADDATVDINGTPVPLYELVEAYKMKMGKGDTPDQLNPDDEVEVEGFGRVKVSDLISAYQPGGAGEGGEETPMQNAEDPTDTPAEDVVDPAKQGEGVRTNSKPKVNSKLKIAAAREPGDGLGIDRPETRSDRIERGKSRYSRAVVQGANK